MSEQKLLFHFHPYLQGFIERGGCFNPPWDPYNYNYALDVRIFYTNINWIDLHLNWAFLFVYGYVHFINMSLHVN